MLSLNEILPATCLHMKPLIILEMANNHAGSVSHGMDIIKAYAEVANDYHKYYHFVFKFQYRNLETFIRADMAGNNDIPLIKRFSETKLTYDEFKILLQCCKNYGFGNMVTPFDEHSVQKCIEHNVDYMKIASCSFTDWPLLEEVAKAGKPVVASCAGVSEREIDKVVAFFRNRNLYLLLQHCVGSYPTIYKRLNVAQIAYLKCRYPHLDIGFSSHEDPESTDIAPLALALGAKSFEKHVALETTNIEKNKYSTSPHEFSRWLKQLHRSSEILGSKNERYIPTESESSSLKNLQRGVFAGRFIKSGEQLDSEDINYAFPPSELQITANDISKYTQLTAKKDLKPNEPLHQENIELTNNREDIHKIACKISKIVRDARVTFPEFADLEISHHYGLEMFHQYGLTMITVVNRGYCKKILILLAGQTHPEQYHKQKEETFHVLWGNGKISLDGIEQSMSPGQVFVIEPETRHMLFTEEGIILEEISSTHYPDDSYYTDLAINENRNRKTFLTHWSMV